MRTLLQQVIDTVTALRIESIRLAGQDHEPSEGSSLLKDAGGTIETFLKATVYPAGAKGTFEKLIDGLVSFGVTAAEVSALHVLRTNYNAAKHDPNYYPRLLDVTKILNDAIEVLKAWIGRSIGSTEASVRSNYRRILWLASWDHYVHGDGEVQIMLPVAEEDADFSPLLDIIYLKGLAWPEVLNPLSRSILPAEGIIPQKFLNMWNAEGDFAGARVFEGEYRELLRTLSKEELRLELLADLKRENISPAMRAAVAIASVDVAQNLTDLPAHDELVHTIMIRAASDYAVPLNAELPMGYAKSMATLLLAIPLDELTRLVGPRFVNRTKYEELRRSSYTTKGECGLITNGQELVLQM